jgi:hypothetical protein
MTVVKMKGGHPIEVSATEDKAHPVQPIMSRGVLQDIKEFAKENPVATGIVGVLLGLGVIAVLKKKQ